LIALFSSPDCRQTVFLMAGTLTEKGIFESRIIFQGKPCPYAKNLP
jgi:hypothetical protein